ncbi:hypothetical protein [Ktedonobacter racemifer]|uniref:hypothetical protein n=1 Tax=Ktedonobacter racemifer TaxID=363277 RepID=UPI0012FB7262|nr:hypothetical protein [Ktedonobacter racemifer]
MKSGVLATADLLAPVLRETEGDQRSSKRQFSTADLLAPLLLRNGTLKSSGTPGRTVAKQTQEQYAIHICLESEQAACDAEAVDVITAASLEIYAGVHPLITDESRQKDGRLVIT